MMRQQISFFVALLLLVDKLSGVFGNTELMVATNFTYTSDLILDNINAKGVIHCANLCTSIQDCGAVEFNKNTELCIMLKYVTITPATAEAATTDNKQMVKRSYGFASYTETTTSHTAIECYTVCAPHGEYLAKVRSKLQSDVVNAARKSYAVFVDGQTADAGTTWTFGDGEVMTYMSWIPGEPNELDLYPVLCLGYFSTYTSWDDGYCHQPRSCMCAKDVI